MPEITQDILLAECAIGSAGFQFYYSSLIGWVCTITQDATEYSSMEFPSSESPSFEISKSPTESLRRALFVRRRMTTND